MLFGLFFAAVASACFVLATPRVSGSMSALRVGLGALFTALSVWTFAFDLGWAEAVATALGGVMLCLPLVSWALAAWVARAARRVQP